MGLFDAVKDVGSVLFPVAGIAANGIAGGKKGPGSDIGSYQPFDFNNTHSPFLDSMNTELGNFKAPTDISAGDSGYTPRDLSGPLPEFQQAREQSDNAINSQASRNYGNTMDAVNRKFAALGGGPSGAAIKQTENVSNDLGAQRDEELNKNNAALDLQEAQTRRQLQESDLNKQFQANQALQGRQFQAQQFNVQAKNQFQQNMFDNKTKVNSLDMAWQKNAADSANDAFNAEMAQYTAKHSGGLLGSGGFLGSGFG